MLGFLKWHERTYATPSNASSNFSTSGRHRFAFGMGMAEVGMLAGWKNDKRKVEQNRHEK